VASISRVAIRIAKHEVLTTAG